MTAIHDITDKKEAEAKVKLLMERKRQASKMEAIGNFASGIAHDFNNALSPIVGHSDILLHELPVGSPHRKSVRSILEGAETATKLVNRIQLFARGNGQSSYVWPMDLKAVLEDAYGFLRSTIPTTVEIELRVADDLPIVAVSEITIKQILMNLCKNATQAFKEEAGVIRIEAYSILVGEDERFDVPAGRYVCLLVRDDGVGMDQSTLEKALDPYFTTKQKGGGMGVGLAVVKAIVESYGGFIHLSSVLNAGTRVEICIPASTRPELSNAEAVPPLVLFEGAGQSILYVDDEVYMVELGTKMLRSLRYQAVGFDSSLQALDHFKDNSDKYVAVISDMTMPAMTGIVMLQRVKEIKPNIKTMLCSGLGDNVTSEGTIAQTDIDSFLPKPFTRGDLARELTRILGL
jgi:nitrogen-specific signal transduction histidine kinase